jgi:hypothetical protein
MPDEPKLWIVKFWDGSLSVRPYNIRYRVYDYKPSPTQIKGHYSGGQPLGCKTSHQFVKSIPADDLERFIYMNERLVLSIVHTLSLLEMLKRRQEEKAKHANQRRRLGRTGGPGRPSGGG